MARERGRGPTVRPKGEEEERKEGNEMNGQVDRQTDGQGCNSIDILNLGANLG